MKRFLGLVALFLAVLWAWPHIERQDGVWLLLLVAAVVVTVLALVWDPYATQQIEEHVTKAIGPACILCDNTAVPGAFLCQRCHDAEIPSPRIAS